MSLGPGDRSLLVAEALEALREAEVIVGYTTYLELIPDLTPGKKVLGSGMRKEIPRCRAAIEHARNGHRVALVSSGDAGIYGMAGLVLDLCRDSGLRVCSVREKPPETCDLQFEVIPGVAAFNAAASLVGAPLMHDFAAVSLSDHLTPWELIEKRLQAVAAADFVTAVYNPRSKARPDLLEKACEILLEHRSPETPVAIVRRAKRQGEWVHLTTLDRIPFDEVDMQSILLIGNSRTYLWDRWMVTPRGYLDKYGEGAEGEGREAGSERLRARRLDHCGPDAESG
ncbi:MAG TPA: precorrin-3B C(17)-methyltransferase [Syntrophobacteraceae bacterium]|nr:precorrin-3B C(17)-methyltransferase [Syntrophobacteraceae bacterium]